MPDLESSFIDWKTVPRVGVPFIDEEHKQLVDIINKIYESVSSGVVSKPDLLRIMMELFDYTVFHFDNEDKVMNEVGYPQRDDHLKQHDKLQQQVLDFTTSFFEFEVDVRKNLLDVLKSWLVVHIENTDQPLSDFIVSKGLDPKMFSKSGKDTQDKKPLTLQDAFLEIKKSNQEVKNAFKELEKSRQDIEDLKSRIDVLEKGIDECGTMVFSGLFVKFIK